MSRCPPNLEDRRVLFADESIEVPNHCVSSVLELRRYLTSEIQQLADSELCRSLRLMRAACRKFMESVATGAGSSSVTASITDTGGAGDSAPPSVR